MQSEKVLGKFLEERIKSCEAFKDWLLSKTRFNDLRTQLVFSRSDNPWYKSPTTGKGSETDVLLVFTDQQTLNRFAVHIEIKLARGRFGPYQAELYRQRADDWRGELKWGNYDKSTIVLIAPETFYKANIESCAIFDSFIPFSEIAKFVPEFGPN